MSADDIENPCYLLCMVKVSRIVIPGIPHHVTQRGNRRQQTFYCEEDYMQFLSFMRSSCKAYGLNIWAYCLMPNHTHFIAVPETEESLHLAVGDFHQRYSRMLNSRMGWKGCLWQGRFSSFPMDDKHLYFGARYVELNPIRAGLCKSPEEYPWSSARAHLGLSEDPNVDTNALLDLFPNWNQYLGMDEREDDYSKIRKHTSSGRPLGDSGFVSHLEKLTNRDLVEKKRGPKPKVI